MEFGSEQVTGVVDEHSRKRTVFNMIQSYGCRSKVFLPREMDGLSSLIRKRQLVWLHWYYFFTHPGWEATDQICRALGLNLTRSHVSMVTRCYPSTTRDLKIYSVMYIYIDS